VRDPRYGRRSVVGIHSGDPAGREPMGDLCPEFLGHGAGVGDRQTFEGADAGKLQEHDGVGVVDVGPVVQPLAEVAQTRLIGAQPAEIASVVEDRLFALVHEFDVDVFFALEILVDRRSRSPYSPGDRIHRSGVITVGDEKVCGIRFDLVSSVRPAPTQRGDGGGRIA
jgi:hypothetical protein